eukprot:403368437
MNQQSFLEGGTQESVGLTIQKRFKLEQQIGKGASGTVSYINCYFWKTVRQIFYRNGKVWEKLTGTYFEYEYHSFNEIYSSNRNATNNILIKSDDFENAKSSILTLIDFSSSQRFKDKHGRHFPQQKISSFNGNLAFSSLYQMMGLSPSRRDDILSRLYLLLFLKEGSLPWLTINLNKDRRLAFKQVKYEKKAFHQYIQFSDHHQCLMRQLIKYADQLDFEEKPDYRFITQQLLKLGEIEYSSTNNVDWKMDWSRTSGLYGIKQKCATRVFIKVDFKFMSDQ